MRGRKCSCANTPASYNLCVEIKYTVCLFDHYHSSSSAHHLHHYLSESPEQPKQQQQQQQSDMTQPRCCRRFSHSFPFYFVLLFCVACHLDRPILNYIPSGVQCQVYYIYYVHASMAMAWCSCARQTRPPIWISSLHCYYYSILLMLYTTTIQTEMCEWDCTREHAPVDDKNHNSIRTHSIDVVETICSAERHIFFIIFECLLQDIRMNIFRVQRKYQCILFVYSFGHLILSFPFSHYYYYYQ